MDKNPSGSLRPSLTSWYSPVLFCWHQWFQRWPHVEQWQILCLHWFCSCKCKYRFLCHTNECTHISWSETQHRVFDSSERKIISVNLFSQICYFNFVRNMPIFTWYLFKIKPTCIATGKSFCASGGKNTSTAFLVNGWFPWGGWPTSIMWSYRDRNKLHKFWRKLQFPCRFTFSNQ